MKITNVKIINHDRIIENADIFIEGNKIKKIVYKPGKGSKTIIPGFIEPHIHGFNNYDAMNGTKDIEKISKGLKRVGVTTFFPTLMTAPWEHLKKAAQAAGNAKNVGAKIGGIHLEGPFISKEKKGAHDPRYLIKGTRKKIKELFDLSQEKISRITWAPEVNDLNLINYMTKELGIVVLVGHSNASAKITYKAADYGATSCTHLWNGMSGVINRAPGVAEAVLQDNRFIAELICDLIHVDKETIKFTIKNKTPDNVIVVSDSIAPAGLPDGIYESGGQKVEKIGTTIRVVSSGSIAGGAGSINIGFATLVKMGYRMQDIVKMTSYNIARNQNLQKIGEIKEGYYADIIFINKDYKIESVLIDGK